MTGRESRLPLKIKGEGLGPRLQFSFDVLDIQSVFVNSGHAYEVRSYSKHCHLGAMFIMDLMFPFTCKVILENKGDIEAEYSLVPTDTLFGPKFTFVPSSGQLPPGGLQVIQVCN